jgi:hypothetical protein
MASAPRTTIDIPKVESRSKALITLEGSYGGYNPLTQTIQQALSNLVLIGNVSKISMPIKRGAVERRELNASNIQTAAQILEIVPGLVDFEGFRLNNIVTYQEDFLEACGFFGGRRLEYQSYPMLFVLTLPSPEPSVFPVRTFLIDKAWILDNPYEFSVEEKEDLRITQEVELRLASITEVQIPG